MLEMTHTASCREQGPGLVPGCVLGHARYPDTHSFYSLVYLSSFPGPWDQLLAHTSSTLEEWQEAPNQLREMAPKSSHGSPSHIHECYWMTQFLPAEGLAEVQSSGGEEGPPGSTAWEDRPT